MRKQHSLVVLFDKNGLHKPPDETELLIVIPDEDWDDTSQNSRYLIRVMEDALIAAIRTVVLPGASLTSWIEQSSLSMKDRVKLSKNDQVKVIPASLLAPEQGPMN